MTDATEFSLADLVALVCPEDDERAVYQKTRRVQNWITEGLLRPIGDAHSGRGVHRKFDCHELGKAAVLLELYQSHLPNKFLDVIAHLFDDAREPSKDRRSKGLRPPTPGQIRKQKTLATHLENACSGQYPLYLTLYATRARVIKAKFGSRPDLSKDARSGVMVNLTEILSALSLPPGAK